MLNKQTTLDTLALHTPARIVQVNGTKVTRRRLLDLGLLAGEMVEIRRVAPLGDPLDIVVKGYHLSLRKHEAEQIVIAIGDGGPDEKGV